MPKPEAPHAFTAHAASSYREGPPRQVPGYESLLRMVSMLLAERTPEAGRVLVLGAGGGLELESLAEAHPGWRFDGVDPSAEMLALAADATARFDTRVRLHLGTIADAPAGPFDAAACLLTFHFIAREQRLETLRQVRRRLRPGAPFALAHISFSQSEPARTHWIARHVAYGAPEDADPARLAAAREAIATRLTILSPAEEEATLAEAGFAQVALFYAGLSFRGWIGYASP